MDLNHILSITPDAYGGVWLIDSQKGLLRWRDGLITQRELPAALRNGPPLADTSEIVSDVDNRGRLWLAVRGGDLGVMGDDGHFDTTRAVDLDPLSGPPLVFALYQDRNLVMWVGTSHGLYRIIDDDLVPIRLANDPRNRLVLGIVEDEVGDLWLSTTTGIIHLDRREVSEVVSDPLHSVSYDRFDTSDGLRGVPVWRAGGRTAALAKDGRLWFITSTGLAIIDRSILTKTVSASLPQIDAVFVDEHQTDLVSQVKLPPRTQRLRIDYSAAALTRPTTIGFRYRLEGFDANWVDAATGRQAFYTNLPPGSYRFHVVASQDHQWPQAGAVWAFSIRPAFYQTRWFYSVCSFATLLMVWTAWRLRLAFVRRHFVGAMDERLRLSREIHDTLLQGLVGVALRCDAIAGTVDSSPQSATAQLVHLRKHVESYIREARHFIWSLRSPMLETGSLVSALQAMGEELTKDQHIRFTVNVKGTARSLPGNVEEQVLRIGHEAITNAVRHSNPSCVRVDMSYDTDAVSLSISDDGCGFDPIRRGLSVSTYGLRSMKERTEQIDGDFVLTASPGNGTQVVLIVPS
jgi:hypothetical protein